MLLQLVNVSKDVATDFEEENNVYIPQELLDAEELDTQEALLDQIAYERAYELYSQGLRWEDARRLPEQVQASMWLRFLPIPLQECLANTGIDC